MKEIRRRGKDGLKISQQRHYVSKKVSRIVSVRGKGRVCVVSLGRRGRSNYGEDGRGMRSCCPTTSQILGPPGIGLEKLSVAYVMA